MGAIYKCRNKAVVKWEESILDSLNNLEPRKPFLNITENIEDTHEYMDTLTIYMAKTWKTESVGKQWY